MAGLGFRGTSTYPARALSGHALAGRMIIQSQGSPICASSLCSELSPRSRATSRLPAQNCLSPHAYPRPGIPRAIVEGRERCVSCSKDEVWSVFDAFCSMDRADESPLKQSVGRSAFFKGLKDKRSITMERMRLLKRTGLHQRFRQSAADVDLDEMLRLSWPKASHHDLRTMRKWCLLKQVNMLVRRPNFRCDQNDMRCIFNILDETGAGSVTMRDLVLAQIPAAADGCEATSLDLDQKVTFPEFLSRYQLTIKARYVNPDTRRQLEQTEQRQLDQDLMKSQLRGLLPCKSEV